MFFYKCKQVKVTSSGSLEDVLSVYISEEVTQEK